MTQETFIDPKAENGIKSRGEKHKQEEVETSLNARSKSEQEQNIESPIDAVPLCVDLDGTLIFKDVTWIGVKRLLAHNPFSVFKLLFWFLHGRAHLKSELGKIIQFSPKDWGYIPEVLAYVKSQKETGRRIILVTAADQRSAKVIADHCGLFEGVMASNGQVNLRAGAKRLACVQQFGEAGFDYIGNSKDDLVVWASSRKAILSPITPVLVKKAAYSAFKDRIIDLSQL